MRTLVSLEIDQNLARLKGFCNQIAELSPARTVYPDNAQAYYHARTVNMLKLAFPLWSHKMWEGSVTFLPAAMSSARLEQCHQIHDRLEALTNTRNTMAIFWEKFQNDWNLARQYPKGQISLTKVFDENGWRLMSEFDELADCLLREGNPLES